MVLLRAGLRPALFAYLPMVFLLDIPRRYFIILHNGQPHKPKPSNKSDEYRREKICLSRERECKGNLEVKLREVRSANTGNGIGIAAFVISIVNLVFILALSFYILIEAAAPFGITHENDTGRIIALENEISSLRAEEQSPIAVEGGLSKQEKDILYQTVRGTDIAKQKKIEQGREIAMMIWSAAREYYNKVGEYPPASQDVLRFGNCPIGVKVSPPPGTSYFIYSILANGQVMASPNTAVDASLGDVSNITVDCNGSVAGGNY